MSAPAVRLENVTRTFGEHTAVDRLDLEVPEGSIYGFIGPNGSGKTTTMRLILHILHPDGGRIEVLGRDGLRAANDSIGYLPEERGLYKRLKALRHLVYFAQLKGMPAREARAEAREWLERMDLGAWEKKPVEVLSKGMKQKIQFIAAILARPRLVILDEPFSGLDPVNMEAIRAVILELRKRGTTIIFSTHDMEMAEKMCDSIFMIYKGKKVLDGSLHDIQSAYGADTIRLRLDDNGGGPVDLAALPGIASVRDFGQIQELRYEGDAQGILRAVMEKAPVLHFEVAQPSLHDIFVRIASPDPADLAEA